MHINMSAFMESEGEDGLFDCPQIEENDDDTAYAMHQDEEFASHSDDNQFMLSDCKR